MRIIRGKYGRRRFTVPTLITARPTTDFARENIFNVMENMIDFESGPKALDLFAGTGAISFEFLSRGCSEVTSIEKSAKQLSFMKSVKEKLGDENIDIIKGDAIRFAAGCMVKYDIIFADPPYNLPEFDKIPEIVLNSNMLKPTTIFILEHSAARDYSMLPHFKERRAYGSVNFSIFDMSIGNNP